MKEFNRTAIVMIAALISLFMVSCATQPEKKAWDLVWPLPPDEPKIKYVGSYRATEDVEEAAGVVESMFGEENRTSLRKPYGVAVDAEGRIYVSDIGRVFVFDTKNKKLKFIGDEGMGKLRIPIGIAVAQNGNIYVTDSSLDRVMVYDRNGKFITAIGHDGDFIAPAGVIVDNQRQRIYVADARRHDVRAYGLNGELLMTIGKQGAGDGEFSFPSNVALDSKGDLYVADTMNFRVEVFSPDGKFLRKFGQQGDAYGTFSRPKGIAVDSEDHVYVVDAAFNNFQIFDKDGNLLLFIGEAGRNPGQFLVPAGIATDGQDGVYVVDQLNARVQVFQYLGSKKARQQDIQTKKTP